MFDRYIIKDNGKKGVFSTGIIAFDDGTSVPSEVEGT